MHNFTGRAERKVVNTLNMGGYIEARVSYLNSIFDIFKIILN
jgi:hypothetical protein